MLLHALSHCFRRYTSKLTSSGQVFCTSWRLRATNDPRPGRLLSRRPANDAVDTADMADTADTADTAVTADTTDTADTADTTDTADMIVASPTDESSRLRERIASLEGDRDSYRELAFAVIKALHDQARHREHDNAQYRRLRDQVMAKAGPRSPDPPELPDGDDASPSRRHDRAEPRKIGV